VNVLLNKGIPFNLFGGFGLAVNIDTFVNRQVRKMLTSFAFSKPTGKYIFSYTLNKVFNGWIKNDAGRKKP